MRTSRAVWVFVFGMVAFGPGCSSSSDRGDGGTGEPTGVSESGADATSDATAIESDAAQGSVGDALPDGPTSVGPSSPGDAASDGSPGAGSEAGPCGSSELFCGGLCVPNDAVNCGACGNDCSNEHATSTAECVDGVCTFPGLTCAAGWAHCAGDAGAADAGPGCETDLSQAAHCGSCANACASGSTCSGSAGSYACNGIAMMACAAETAFALFSDGTIEAVGANQGDNQISQGLLGDGDGVDTMSATLVQVSGISTATAIAAGDGHACALLADQTVKCWGDNTYGQLGVDVDDDGGVGASLVPVAVTGLTNVIAIAAGSVHTCALIQGGTVKCWGSNNEGELGTSLTSSCNGSDACSYEPISVPGLSSVSAITIGADEDFVGDTGDLGADHTCALLSNGTIRCWGYDIDGELGDGTKTPNSPYGTSTLAEVSGITNATAIAANDGGVCALLTGGTVKCWGNHWNDALPDSGFQEVNTTPVLIEDLTDAVSLSVGSTSQTICAVESTGAAVCWGNGLNGQLGNGAPAGATEGTTTSVPVGIQGLTGVAGVVAGTNFTMALLQNGTASAWGADESDEIDNAAANLNFNPSPLLVQW
jgi:alpha-tubulin suppressor-like RCC1 family protein